MLLALALSTLLGTSHAREYIELVRCNDVTVGNTVANDWKSTRKLVIRETLDQFQIELRLSPEKFIGLTKTRNLDLNPQVRMNTFTRGTYLVTLSKDDCKKVITDSKKMVFECGQESMDGFLPNATLQYFDAESRDPDSEARKNLRSLTADLFFQTRLLIYKEANPTHDNGVFNAKLMVRKDQGQNETAESWQLPECQFANP